MFLTWDKYPENMVIRCLKHGLGLVTDGVPSYLANITTKTDVSGQV